MINLNPKCVLVQSKATVEAFSTQYTRNVYKYRGELHANLNGEKISVKEDNGIYYRTGVSIIDCVKYVHAGPDSYEITVLGKTKHRNIKFDEVMGLLEKERDELLKAGPTKFIPDPWIDYIEQRSQ